MDMAVHAYKWLCMHVTFRNRSMHEPELTLVLHEVAWWMALDGWQVRGLLGQ